MVALVACTTGCGGASNDAGARRAAPPVPHTDQQLAGAVLVSASDFASSWRERPPTPPAACGHTGWEQAAARRGSPSFTLDYGSIQQNVGVFPTAKAAERVFAALRTRRSERCFSRSLLSGVETSAAERAISKPVAIRSGGTHLADEVRYEIRAESRLGIVSVYADRVRIQTGRVISVLVMVNVGQPVDEGVYEHLVARVRSLMRHVDQNATA